MKKNIICIVLSAALICVNIHAKTIGLSCIQNTKAPKQGSTLTTILETAFFDQCFEQGIIVTGADLNKEGERSYKNEKAIESLFESSPDYVVAIYSEYKSNIKDGEEKIDWKQLKWKVIEMNSHILLSKGTVIPNMIKEDDMQKKAHFIGTMIAETILGEVLTQK